MSRWIQVEAVRRVWGDEVRFDMARSRSISDSRQTLVRLVRANPDHRVASTAYAE
jgi:hypothetical protein